jgi:hypothetical protein
VLLDRDRSCISFFEMERTGIEPVTSDLQIPGYESRLGQIRSIKAKLCWLGGIEIGYSGTRCGTRFGLPRSRRTGRPARGRWRSDRADASRVFVRRGATRQDAAGRVGDHHDFRSRGPERARHPRVEGRRQNGPGGQGPRRPLARWPVGYRGSLSAAVRCTPRVRRLVISLVRWRRGRPRAGAGDRGARCRP